jgi:hypothetical protein
MGCKSDGAGNCVATLQSTAKERRQRDIHLGGHEAAHSRQEELHP